MNKMFRTVKRGYHAAKRNAAKLAAASVFPFAVGAAMAQTTVTTFDPTPYVTNILATIAGIVAIGGAVFLVYLALRSTKWSRRAL